MYKKASMQESPNSIFLKSEWCKDLEISKPIKKIIVFWPKVGLGIVKQAIYV